MKWYFYPFIYFSVTSLACVYAWYHRPIRQRTSIEVVFKTVALVPALIWSAAITSWISIIVLMIIISFWLRKRWPDIFLNESKMFSKIRAHFVLKSLFNKEEPKNLRKKILNVSAYCFGYFLIFAGVILAVWITRPYIALLLSSSKMAVLENKVRLGQVEGNRIIIPSVLVDAPILEGASKDHLSRGVCHVPNSPVPGQGGNCIVEGHNLAEFGLWKPQSFFSVLEVVEKGASVYIFYNHRKYTYTVREKTYKDVNDPKLYDLRSGERLTLLTCVSTWSPTIYTNRRTVVTAAPQLIENVPCHATLCK